MMACSAASSVFTLPNTSVVTIVSKTFPTINPSAGEINNNGIIGSNFNGGSTPKKKTINPINQTARSFKPFILVRKANEPMSKNMARYYTNPPMVWEKNSLEGVQAKRCAPKSSIEHWPSSSLFHTRNLSL